MYGPGSSLIVYIALPAQLTRHVLAEGYQATLRSHVPAAKTPEAAIAAYSKYHPDEPGEVIQVKIPSTTPQGAGGYRIPGQRLEPDRLSRYEPVAEPVAEPSVKDFLNIDHPLVQQVLAENPLETIRYIVSTNSKKNWTLEQLQNFDRNCFFFTEKEARADFCGVSVAVYKVRFEELTGGSLGRVLSAERLMSSGKKVAIG